MGTRNLLRSRFRREGYESGQSSLSRPSTSPIKFKYDQKIDIFAVSYVLPKFAEFPFDYGFIPSTLAEDGDPIDIMVLVGAPSSSAARCLLVLSV